MAAPFPSLRTLPIPNLDQQVPGNDEVSRARAGGKVGKGGGGGASYLGAEIHDQLLVRTLASGRQVGPEEGPLFKEMGSVHENQLPTPTPPPATSTVNAARRGTVVARRALVDAMGPQ